MYRLFHRPLLEFIRARVTHPEIALELVQEVFLKAFRRRDRFDGSRAFAPWIWSIARHTLIDHLRGSYGRRRFDDDGTIPVEEVASSEDNAETRMLNRERGRRLARRLRPLTRLQKRVLWFGLIRGLPPREIARKLGITPVAAKSLAYRARKLLVPPAPLT